jgi:hypothetical protein
MGIEGVGMGENGDRRSGMGECEERAEAAASPRPPRPQPQFPRGILDECVAVRRNGLSAILRVVCVSALVLKYMHT